MSNTDKSELLYQLSTEHSKYKKNLSFSISDIKIQISSIPFYLNIKDKKLEDNLSLYINSAKILGSFIKEDFYINSNKNMQLKRNSYYLNFNVVNFSVSKVNYINLIITIITNNIN